MCQTVRLSDNRTTVHRGIRAGLMNMNNNELKSNQAEPVDASKGKNNKNKNKNQLPEDERARRSHYTSRAQKKQNAQLQSVVKELEKVSGENDALKARLEETLQELKESKSHEPVTPTIVLKDINELLRSPEFEEPQLDLNCKALFNKYPILIKLHKLGMADNVSELVDRIRFALMRAGPNEKTIQGVLSNAEHWIKITGSNKQYSSFWFEQLIREIASDVDVVYVPEEAIIQRQWAHDDLLWEKTYQDKSGWGMVKGWFERVKLLNKSDYLADKWGFKPWESKSSEDVFGSFYSRLKHGVESYKVERIKDFCVGEREYKFDERFKETSTPRCVEKAYEVGFTINANHIWIPRSCSHNEKAALLERQMLPADYLDGKATSEQYWKEAVKSFLKQDVLPHPVWDGNEVYDFLERLPFGRRAVLYKAYQQLLDFGCDVDLINEATKMFVKVEWLLGKEWEKRSPRCISGKYDAFLMMTGPLYHRWQKQCVQKLWRGAALWKQKFIYTGGMSALEIGDIVSHFERLGWWAYPGDFSRYDGHTEEEGISAEGEIYHHYLGEDYTKLWMKVNKRKGRTLTGHRYEIKGKVDSGIISTSFGNTLRGFLIADRIEAELKKTDPTIRMVIVQLGDDNIPFFNKQIDMNVMIRVSHLMGHILDVKEVGPDDYDKIDYCSMWALEVTPGQRVLVPKLGRVLSKSFVTHRELPPDTTIEDHMRVVATGYKNFNWLPGLSEILKQFNTSANQHPTPEWQVSLDEALTVDQDTVNACWARIYDILPSEINELCSSIDWTIPHRAYQHPIFDKLLRVDGCNNGYNECRLSEAALVVG